MDAFLAALALVLQTETLLSLVLAALFGFLVGVLPGVTATMAVALMVPVTFLLSPLAAIASIVAASAMVIFAGDVPGALLRIPGTPASAAYVEDAYRLTRQGRAGYVLGVGAVCSVIGGVFSTLVLMLAAPALADVALQFSVFEFFWLSALGLSCAVFVAGNDPLKGMVSLLIGLLIATVGMDYSTGHPRFTFGNVALLEGVSFIPALIGMFALPEILRAMLAGRAQPPAPAMKPGTPWRDIGHTVVRERNNIGRSSVLGSAIGVLPGASADIASWISFAVAKRFSRQPGKWGTGHVEGIVAGSSANNSALGSAWIPALVFAIPGDTITAIAIGVLYLKGMNPGPTVFVENADLVYAVFIVFLLANLLLLPFGWLAIRIARVVLAVPRQLIMPALLVLAIVGAFAINNDATGIVVMLCLGLLAYFLEAHGFPVAPIVLGIVLGKIVEQNLIQALISTQGSLAGFFERPIAGTLGVLTVLVWCYPLLRAVLRRLRAREQA
ncbi:tripartite tricarboxylate transporter permease [Orrella sp. JC864]|uniref:tripartite tricarboxylate transporter permease n=1 Tax=Orrella sp. JC864 TaxID=3120298 RepID=UPI003008C5BB